MLSFSSLLYNRCSDFSAVASFASERTLLSGGSQPVIWHPGLDFTQVNRQLRLGGRGIIACTGTPTYTFTFRLGTTKYTGTVTTDPIIGVSQAITMLSSVSNKMFEFYLDIFLVTPGIDSSNMTVSTGGWIWCPGGFATTLNPYPLEKSAPDTATWTQTGDASIDNYINCNITCSASDPANTITLKHLWLAALN